MKYFVVSDLHSYLTPLLKVLEKNNFNKDTDTLVVCGDVFDGGNETVELYEYLKSLPNLVLIRGNHELIYQELLKKTWPDDIDYACGTVRTFCNIAGISDKKMNREYYILVNSLYGANFKPNEEIPKTWKQVKEKVINSEINKWINSDVWKNYFELKDYVLVHSWVPLKKLDKKAPWYIENRKFEWLPNWREIKDQALWNDATWGSPLNNYKNGLWKEDKTLVVGHWYCNYFHEEFENDLSENYGIYYGDKIIAIDSRVIWTKNVNLLIIEEGE